MISSLNYYNDAQVAEALDYPRLISSLKEAFSSEFYSPLRAQYSLRRSATGADELLVMPAWTDSAGAVKLATVFPSNPDRGMPIISGLIVLFDGRSGRPIALMYAGEVTARRTAAASALASSLLSNEDSTRLLILGTGRLVSYLAEAHFTVRKLSEISVWGRNGEKASQAVKTLKEQFSGRCAVNLANDLDNAIGNADIVSTATRSAEPLVKMQAISSGTHLDLVGGYRPDMREVDDACIQTASLFVDTKEGVLAEAGDFIQSIASSAITAEDICADLSSLCLRNHLGRSSPDEITLFKSVGFALEDLVAAKLVVDAYQSRLSGSTREN